MLERMRTRSVTHGGSRTRLYSVWKSVVATCTNPRHTNWWRYGGRGVKFDPAWRSFEAFAADVGEPPSPAHVLGKPDPDADYTKETCRWMTKRERALSACNAVLVAHEGETRTAKAWAEEAGLHPSTMNSRVKAGWTPRAAIETPVARGNRR